jgi:hypothetical protein
MPTPGQALIIGHLAGKLRAAREAKEIPVVRMSTLEPNIPALIVCVAEGPTNEEWYAITAEPIERPDWATTMLARAEPDPLDPS